MGAGPSITEDDPKHPWIGQWMQVCDKNIQLSSSKDRTVAGVLVDGSHIRKHGQVTLVVQGSFDVGGKDLGDSLPCRISYPGHSCYGRGLVHGLSVDAASSTSTVGILVQVCTVDNTTSSTRPGTRGRLQLWVRLKTGRLPDK